MIHNVSLDLWGTVLKSNPRFKRLRANFIRSKYRLASASDVIETVLKKTGVLVDNIDRAKQVIHSPLQRYKSAYDNLGLQASDRSILEDMKEFDDIFLDNLPEFFDGDTERTISKIRKRTKSLSVISNTGYVDGYLMREALTHMGISGVFDHMLFSDEIEVSKPHRGIFDEWARLVANGKDVVNVSTFLHVGDDRLADYEGPKALKMESFLINGTTGRNIKSVITFLDGKL